MSLQVAENLFRDLQSKKRGSAFTRVDFVVGDFEDKPYSGPQYFPDWAEGRARTFVCDVVYAEENDTGASCTILGE